MHFALVYLIELLATNSGQDGKLFFLIQLCLPWYLCIWFIYEPSLLQQKNSLHIFQQVNFSFCHTVAKKTVNVLDMYVLGIEFHNDFVESSAKLAPRSLLLFGEIIVISKAFLLYHSDIFSFFPYTYTIIKVVNIYLSLGLDLSIYIHIYYIINIPQGNQLPLRKTIVKLGLCGIHNRCKSIYKITLNNILMTLQ